MEMREAASGDAVKVWFKFEPREGWLPYDTEGLWAAPTGSDTAEIENVPFLQDGVAVGDIVRYMVDEDQTLWAVDRVHASGNCTVRVLPLPDGPLGPDARQVHERFRPFGVDGEVFSEDLPLVALNVPAAADFAAVKALLAQGEAAGWWQAEVSCANERWNVA
ncbi:DUF4265 domain-containing protein [Actinoplanes sp. NPDC049316]|uniref:DUF4265 domain-containing protein n=1 Tax=Actinoplanes sp. NPDC049316 TaxID=3154727 RepID=UPI00342CDA0A